jgi:peroxiredoxin
VVSVSSDEKAEEAGKFAKEIKATFPVLHDASGKVTEKFGVVPIPANVIVGRDGKVIASIEGPDPKTIEAGITKALGK